MRVNKWLINSQNIADEHFIAVVIALAARDRLNRPTIPGVPVDTRLASSFHLSELRLSISESWLAERLNPEILAKYPELFEVKEVESGSCYVTFLPHKDSSSIVLTDGCEAEFLRLAGLPGCSVHSVKLLVVLNSLRKHIIDQSRRVDASIDELTKILGITKQAVLRRLDYLKNVGLVTVRKVGRRNNYEVHNDRIAQLLADPSLIQKLVDAAEAASQREDSVPKSEAGPAIQGEELEPVAAMSTVIAPVHSELRVMDNSQIMDFGDEVETAPSQAVSGPANQPTHKVSSLSTWLAESRTVAAQVPVREVPELAPVERIQAAPTVSVQRVLPLEMAPAVAPKAQSDTVQLILAKHVRDLPRPVRRVLKPFLYLLNIGGFVLAQWREFRQE